MGAEVHAMYAPFKARAAKKKESISAYGLPYTAASVSVLVPSAHETTAYLYNPSVAAIRWADDHLSKYLKSISTGVSALNSYVSAYAADCPRARFVLAGYSQGAIVVHQAENKMKAALLHKVVATVLLADGDRVRRSKAKHFGTAPVSQEGAQPYSILTWKAKDVSAPALTAEICNAGDIVCDTSDKVIPMGAKKGAKVHTSYSTTNTAMIDAARWAAGLI